MVEESAKAQIGEQMEDGTIYVGISPDTKKPMYARPKDETGSYTFNDAAKYSKNVGGGFRVPSKRELNVLWENRNAGKLLGTFNLTGSDPAGWYWSSSPHIIGNGWAQRFSDGSPSGINLNKHTSASLRFVR